MNDPLPSLPQAHAHAGCTCGHEAGHAAPVLDARTIPHGIRHGAIFGALDSLAPGSALILVAPHDPLPLLAQARDRYGEGLETEYLERGPEAWRILLRRT